MTITVMLIAEHDQRAGHYDLQSVWRVTRACVMTAQLVRSHDLGDNENSWSCRWLVMPERIRWYLHKTLFKTAKYTPSCLRSVITIIIITMVLLLSPANPKTLIYYWLLLLSVTSLCTAEEQSDQPRIPLHFLHLVKRVEARPPFSGWPSRAAGQSHLQEYELVCKSVRVYVYPCVYVAVCMRVWAPNGRKAQKRPFLSPLTLGSVRPTRRVFFERGQDGTLPRLSPSAQPVSSFSLAFLLAL